MGRERTVWRDLRRGLLALALIAFFVRALTPPGFMVAEARAPGGFPLVICTGHGQPSLGGQDHAPPGKRQADGACVFAGHAAAPPPPLVRLPTAQAVATAEAQPVLPVSLAPGRGLAAPPPPARGPPLRA